MKLSAAEVMPFPGYREEVPLHGFARGKPPLHATLEHFYQSERFRGVEHSLREAIMNAPSAREAHKLGAKHADEARPDWEERKEHVMRAGLWMMLREHPRLALEMRRSPGSIEAHYPFRDGFWSQPAEGSSTDRFHSLVEDIEHRLNGSTVRVAVTGGRSFKNAFLLKTKLEGFFRKLTPDVLLIGPNRGCDEMAERWAISQSLPVRHFLMRGRGSRTERERHNEAILRAATHVVVFSQGEVDTERFIATARAMSRPVRVVQPRISGISATSAAPHPR